MIGVRDGQEVSEDKEVLSCPPTLSTQGIDLFSIPVSFTFSRTAYKWNFESGLFRLRNAFETYVHCCMYQKFVLFSLLST